MGSTKSRRSKRNTSRPTAYSFLSNIYMGNDDKEPAFGEGDIALEPEELMPSNDNTEDINQEVASLHSSDSSLPAGADDDRVIAAHTDSEFRPAPVVGSLAESAAGLLSTLTDNKKSRRKASLDDEDVQHHKLTREDSERPIASEKIKKKSNHTTRDQNQGTAGLFSMIRYYTGKLRPSTARWKLSDTISHGYVQQQLAHADHYRRRTALSYAHFLSPSGSLLDDAIINANLDTMSAYDPFFLDNDSYSNFGKLSSSLNTLTGQNIRPSDVKREMNEQFRIAHPELAPEITLSKIRSIKSHLLAIGKEVDLEVSSIAHAYVYFEKLVIKNVVTKKNRKLIAVNEAKGTWCEPLLEAVDDELDIDSEAIHEHEFAVFADLEFDLYIPRREFMPHFEQVIDHMDTTVEEYLDDSHFFDVKT